jgi:hypothetical protein
MSVPSIHDRETGHAFVARRVYLWRMLFLAAIIRLSSRPEPPPNDLLAQTRLRIGHLGFIIIALVFVLVTFWQR